LGIRCPIPQRSLWPVLTAFPVSANGQFKAACIERRPLKNLTKNYKEQFVSTLAHPAKMGNQVFHAGIFAAEQA
jgi:hypothetical protein